MTPPQLPQYPKGRRVKTLESAAPPRLVEYTYYAILFYGMLAPGLGILVPNLAGGMLLMLAAFCVHRLGAWATAVYAPITLPLACAMSYLVVQITFHGGSITHGMSFITWMLTLIIVQSLCLRRGFLHRCTLVLFIMGLITLPYLMFVEEGLGSMNEPANMGRDGIITGDFNNADGLGTWFGFYCLYFIIVGIEAKRNWVRVASSLAAIGCLFIVGLTVCRGALLGIAIGTTLAFRHLLRRGFVPLLVFLILSGIIFSFGVFDQIIALYTTRGTEETGRGRVWPVALEHFLSAPLLGVGAAHTNLLAPGSSKRLTPHNGFLYFAVSSGVLPLALFVAWWMRAAQNAFSYGERLDNGPFRLPLLVYTFVTVMVGDLGFMAPWSIVTISIVMAPNIRRLVLHRRASDGQRFVHHTEARPRIAHRQL